ncbi:unnamed protein product, partial [Nesidiocoris tenuis]
MHPWYSGFLEIKEIGELKLCSPGVRLTGSGRTLIGRRESVPPSPPRPRAPSRRPMRGRLYRPDPVNRTPCEPSLNPLLVMP